MRHITLYGGAFVCAIVFYLLQQVLRGSFYAYLMPPLSGAVLDAVFAVIYGLCAFVMVGATSDFLWRRYTKQRLIKQRMVPALKSMPKGAPQRSPTSARSKVFH